MISREEQLHRLRTEAFDLLVIGGGATGCGVALDAVSRGLSVALVEAQDFAAGTSSRSTKLLHGGVRYLERAVLDVDLGQLKLVRECLQERYILMKLAPHLSDWLPILTPLYRRFETPYVLTGLKLYDRLAGKERVPPSRYVPQEEALARCPTLHRKGLKGGVLYYDGQFNDARMSLAVVLRAADLGAAVANHVKVTGFLKSEGKLTGAELEDTSSGERWQLGAKAIVNCTGPLADHIRKIDNPEAKPLLKPSSGIHIILKQPLAEKGLGILIPKTDDKRVLFVLPWLGHTLVGTTDNPAEPETNPRPKEEEIRYVLAQLKRYFDVEVAESDILASWSGLRPLVSEEGAASTASLSRDHLVTLSRSDLITVVGGKWTTYRLMAMDATEAAIEAGQLRPKGSSRTHEIPLMGAENFRKDGASDLKARFSLDDDIARHLHSTYGDKAAQVAEMPGRARLVAGYPFLEAEAAYSIANELALTSTDIIARRMRLGFLNREAALQALPKVQNTLMATLGWSEARRSEDEKAFREYLG